MAVETPVALSAQEDDVSSPTNNISSGACRSRRWFLTILVVGIAIRLILAPLTSYTNDDYQWYLVVVSGAQHIPLYSRPGYSYPPIWGWFLWTCGYVYHFFGGSISSLGSVDLHISRAAMLTGGALSTTVTSPLFNLGLKGWLTICDIATALILRRIVSSELGRPNAGNFAFGLYFLNPLVINESAIRIGFDGMVALTVASALLFALQDKYGYAAAALTIGAFTKLTPVFLLPIFVATALSRRISWSTLRDTQSTLLRVLAGTGIPTLIIVAVLARTHEFSNMFHATFARASTGLFIGGLGIDGLRHFAHFHYLLADSLRQPRTFLDINVYSALIGTLAASVWAWRKARSDRQVALVVASTLATAIIVVTTPTSQGSYVLWLTPGLVLLACIRPRLFTIILLLLTFSACVFELTYYGPSQILYPLAEHTGWISPATLGRSVVNWYQRGTSLWGSSYKENYSSICVGVSLFAYLLLLVFALERNLRFPHPAESARPTLTPTCAADPTRPGPVESHHLGGALLVSAGLLVTIALLAALLPTDSGFAARIGLVRDSRGNRVTVAIPRRVSGGQTQNRVVAFQVAKRVSLRRVLVVVSNPATIGATLIPYEQAVHDILASNLRLKGFRGNVSVVSNVGLIKNLRALPEAQSTAIVDPSGLLPAEAVGSGDGMLQAWLQAGGQFYWASGPLGYATLTKQGRVTLLRQNGESRVTSAQIHYLPILVGRQADTPTPMSTALNLQYEDSSFSPAILSPLPTKVRVLGYKGSGSASIIDYTIGAGRLIVFAGMGFDPWGLAHDMAIIQMTDAAFSIGPVFSWNIRSLAQSFLIPPSTKGERLHISVFDPSPNGIGFAAAYERVPTG